MSQASKSYYEILGVPQDATDEQLKQAYRRESMRLHPDRNPDNAEAAQQFAAMKEAYEILSDPAKRAEYDATGTVDTTDIAQHAQIQLAMLFLSVCRGVAQNNPDAGRMGAPSIHGTNLISLLSAHLDQQDVTIRNAIKMTDLEIERFRNMISRLRVRKEGVDPKETPIGQALQEHLTNLLRQSFEQKKHLELSNAMRIAAKDYDYMVDTPQTGWNRGPVTSGSLGLSHTTG